MLAGDFLYARSSAMIVEDGNPDILWIFADAIRQMAEGELLQLEKSSDPEVSESHYFAVIERKSAILLAAACEIGSIPGGVTRAERRKLAEFGRELGIAFQLRDDALDYSAGVEALGKPRHGDLREGKVTLPLIAPAKWRSRPLETRVSKITGTFCVPTLRGLRRLTARSPALSRCESPRNRLVRLGGDMIRWPPGRSRA